MHVTSLKTPWHLFSQLVIFCLQVQFCFLFFVFCFLQRSCYFFLLVVFTYTFQCPLFKIAWSLLTALVGNLFHLAPFGLDSWNVSYFLCWFEPNGLKLNIQKMKIMASSPITSWEIDGETVEIVSDFIFLGSKITADGDCSHEIKRICYLGWS